MQAKEYLTLRVYPNKLTDLIEICIKFIIDFNDFCDWIMKQLKVEISREPP